MGLAIKNDEANFEKVRAAWEEQREANAMRNPATLRALLEAEKASGIHGAKGALADPSAAIALVWMRRSLKFQNAIFEGMVADKAGQTSAIAREAYKDNLEGYHNFWLKNTFRAGLSAIPKRDDFLIRLGPGLGESEREAVVYPEMSELVEVQNQVSSLLGGMLVEFDFEEKGK